MIVKKHMAFEAHAWRMRIMKFRENPSSASPDTSQNALGSPTKLPLIIHR